MNHALTHTCDFVELGRVSLTLNIYAVAVAQCSCGAFSFAANRDAGTTAEWLRVAKISTAILGAALPNIEKAPDSEV